MVLNMLTTCSMIKLGKVYGNLMVDLKASNRKLEDRAKRLIIHATGVDPACAGRALEAAGGHVKLAILMIKSGLDAPSAGALLERCEGRLAQAIPGSGARRRALMLRELQKKAVRRVVGMMSGTSVDGVDAAVVEIGGSAAAPQVKLLAFENRPYPPAVREQIFRLFQPQSATVDRVGYMNFLLGELYASAARSVIEKAGLGPEDIDLIGSHGQTIWHQPEICEKDGYPIRYTVQIGEGAVIAGRTGIPTVSDFRVADMAMEDRALLWYPFPNISYTGERTRRSCSRTSGGSGI